MENSGGIKFGKVGTLNVIRQYFTITQLTFFDLVDDKFLMLPCIGMVLLKFFQAMERSLICQNSLIGWQ